METKEVMNLKELAEYLDLHIGTVRRYIRQGRIKGHKIGRKWIFIKAEILSQIEKYQ